jgi:branched-chain amino acid transport system permease protein
MMSLPSLVLVQLLNALSLAALLFLVSAGLSLIFGILRVVNFAHGVFYMVGAYLGFTAVAVTGQFWFALLVVPPIVGVIGAVLEVSTLRFVYDRDASYQLLLTFGVGLVLEESIRLLYGVESRSMDGPAYLSGSVNVFGAVYPSYRIFLVALGTVVAVSIGLFFARTRAGLIIRAVAQNDKMASCLGADVRLVRTLVFGASCALAALGGIAAAPLTTAYIGMGGDVIVDAFVVVVIGGLGSIFGSAAGSVLVAAAQSWGEYYIPETAMVLMYVIMAVVLVWRPRGLFGEE